MTQRSWKSAFFDDIFEPRRSSAATNRSLRNGRSIINYDSMGPHDERYYVCNANHEVHQARTSRRRRRRPTKPTYYVYSTSSKDLALPEVRRGKSISPVLVNIPDPDYSPHVIRRERREVLEDTSGENSADYRVWSNASRFKGSLEELLQPTAWKHINETGLTRGNPNLGQNSVRSQLPPEVRADSMASRQSPFFNSLFPSRANRFGFPVYPERHFGIPLPNAEPVSFAGFNPCLNSRDLVSSVMSSTRRNTSKKSISAFFKHMLGRQTS